MFVGHSAIAFVATVFITTRYFDFSTRSTLLIGGIAGVFALLPDSDTIYAFYVISISQPDSMTIFVSEFWSSLSVVHRGPTHSIIVSTLVVLFVLFITYTERSQFFPGKSESVISVCSLIIIGGLSIAFTLEGELIVGITLMYVWFGMAIAFLTSQWTDFSYSDVTLASAVGLYTHPFGDVFTGELPAFLYPVFNSMGPRIILAHDPTLNFLLVFSIEVFVIGLSIFTYFRMIGVSLSQQTTPVYVFVIGGVLSPVILHTFSPPTVDSAYSFVYPVVILSFMGSVMSAKQGVTVRESCERASVTGFLILAVSVVIYSIGYIAMYRPLG